MRYALTGKDRQVVGRVIRGRPRGLGGYIRTLGAAARVWLIVGRIHLARAARRARHRSGPLAITAQLRREILGWPGVTVAPHRYGGIEFRLGKRELGHLHGDYLADLPFPPRVRAELVATGQALPHHILPLSGWVSYPIRDEAAVPGVLALFRLAYERATAGRERPAQASDGAGA